jgi:F-box protein 21
MNGNIRPDDVPADPMYVDPHRSAEEIPVSFLKSQLEMMGAHPAAQEMYLGQISTSEVVLRCCRNIRQSVESVNQPIVAASPEGYNESNVPDQPSAQYAILWSYMLLGTAPDQPHLLRQLLQMVEHFASHYPNDVSLFEQYILPLFQQFPEYPQLCSTMRAVRSTDAMPKQVRRRSKETEHVRYKIGQVFRHKRYGYHAVITGWDPQCGAAQEWMQRMGVDNLQRGRHQSFYHAMCVAPSNFSRGS